MNLFYSYAVKIKVLAILLSLWLACFFAFGVNPAHTVPVPASGTGITPSYENSLLIWPDEPGFLAMPPISRARSMIVP